MVYCTARTIILISNSAPEESWQRSPTLSTLDLFMTVLFGGFKAASKRNEPESCKRAPDRPEVCGFGFRHFGRHAGAPGCGGCGKRFGDTLEHRQWEAKNALTCKKSRQSISRILCDFFVASGRQEIRVRQMAHIRMSQIDSDAVGDMLTVDVLADDSRRTLPFSGKTSIEGIYWRPSEHQKPLRSKGKPHA
jgi:hypothetical protein